MDSDLKVAHCIASFYQWQEDNPDESNEVGLEFIEAKDSSLTFRANGMLFQLILPAVLIQSDVVSEEIFIAMNLDNTTPDSLLMALNEKLERVRVGPRALERVLDVFSKALISFQGKRRKVQTKHVELQGVLNDVSFRSESLKVQTQAFLDEDEEGSEDGNDADNGDDLESDDGGGAQYFESEHGDDEEDFGLDSLGGVNMKRSLENFSDHEVQQGSGDPADKKGYLHGITRAARARCEEARSHGVDILLSKPAMPCFPGSSAMSHMNDILQFCNVSTVPHLPLVRIQAEVTGVVNDMKVANALGLASSRMMHIFLEFDDMFWSEQYLRKALEVNCVAVRLETPKSSNGLPQNDASLLDSSVGKDLDEEFEAECKKFPGRQKTEAYGIKVLLPELISTFFRYRSGEDAASLRSKPWENGALDETLRHFAAIENPLLGLICFLGTQLRALPSWCAICWSLLPSSVWRLGTCQNDLCLYEFEELGLGATIHQEIQQSPEVVQLELSLACAAATPSRDVFEPFPAFLLTAKEARGRSGWFSKPSGQAVAKHKSRSVIVPQGSTSGELSVKEVQNKKLDLLRETLQSIPSMADLKDCGDEDSLKRKLSKVAFDIWRNKDPSKKSESSNMWLSYDLMRFILSTNRLSFRMLKEKEVLKLSIKPDYQFVVLHDSPEKEAIFEKHRSERGSFFAFHGSGSSNWYSILRNGLRSMSKTRYMSTGAAYGDGIYLADNFGLSYSYAAVGASANVGKPWQNGSLKAGVSVIAICEVVRGSAIEESATRHLLGRSQGIYVVPPDKEDDVLVRYLLVMDLAGAGVELSRSCSIKIDGSILQDHQFKGESIDLGAHYEKLRRGDRRHQQKILLHHRTEAFVRMREDSSCRQATAAADGAHNTVTTPAISESSYSASLKGRERAGSHVSRKPAGELEEVAKPILTLFKENKSSLAFSTATAAAIQAITKEFRNIQNEIHKAKQGVSASRGRHSDSFLANITVDIPNETNLCVWRVGLHQDLFKSYPKLYRDLQELAALKKQPESFVLLETTFPDMYPFQPPFVRVIRPRFVFHTGHVTIGGSICMELLTESGWLPSFSFENVLVQIVNAFVEGEGRLDKKTIGMEYSRQEAEEAFTRVARLHGWKVSAKR